MPKVNSYLMARPATLEGMNIGERIRQERKKRKWSQERLARETGVTQGLISQIESGMYISSRHLAALARALDVSVEWLDTGTGDPRRRGASAPMAFHYPPLIERTAEAIATRDGTRTVVLVFGDEHGTQITLKLSAEAAQTLAQKLAELGK